HVLETGLRLLHPYMPYVTEEIWGYLPKRESLIIVAKWPTTDTAYIDHKAEADMGVMIDLIRGVRNVRAEYGVEPSKKVSVAVDPGSHAANIDKHAYLFARLCNVPSVTVVSSAPDEAASVVVSDAVLYLPLAGLIDYGAEIERLEKEQAVLSARIGKSEGMLSNEGFT